jgi:GNAT superfamily N-acetyltransferase
VSNPLPDDPAERREAARRLTLGEVSPDHPGARAAVAAYVAELGERFVAVFQPGPTTPTERAAEVASMTRPRGVFLLATGDTGDTGDTDDLGAPVACGGLRRLDHTGQDGTFEVKRMWVHPSWRGLGLSRRLLEALEAAAADLGASRVVLDTSRVLTEAVALYARAGYREIDAYNDNPHAEAWFEKRLDAPPGPGPTLTR